MESVESVAALYRTFARQQAAGTSPTLHDWAMVVADDGDLLRRLATLPRAKQQPNLVFAAARVHGAIPGDGDSLRETLAQVWPQVRSTILTRSTQTNEAARCASLLLALQQVPGPIALLEIGASAGLCLVPDRYSYTFNGQNQLDPVSGPSAVVIPIALHGGLAAPVGMPDIVWRAGLDLNPLDPDDVDTLEWLRALVWPEHEERRQRLTAAARIAANERLDIRRADLLEGIAGLASEAPPSATLVIAHSATLAYLEASPRRRALDAVAATGARRVSFEGRGVDPDVPALDAPDSVNTLFVAALDGIPYALADGHGSTLTRPPASVARAR